MFWFLQLCFCWAYDWVHHSCFFYFHWVLSTILTPIITIWAIIVTFTLYAVITCMSKCASLSYNFKKLISFFYISLVNLKILGLQMQVWTVYCTLTVTCMCTSLSCIEYNRGSQWLNRFSLGGEWRPPLSVLENIKHIPSKDTLSKNKPTKLQYLMLL